MPPDPRTPVIIGVGQVSHTPTTDDEAPSADDAVALMARAVETAAGDTATTMLDQIDTVAVVGGLWRHRDPGALVAAELGLGDVHTILTTFGGNVPIELVAGLADRITAGECDVVAVTGGESNLSRRQLARLGIEPPRRAEPATVAVEAWGPPLDMGDLTAVDRGGEMPRNSYAVLDSALRVARGETLDEARDRAAALWEGFARVAAGNPHAADRSGMTASEIRNPSPDNRFVSWPYTKAMCANNNVDHAGAVIMCSTETADRLGVAKERRVHPHGCITGRDTTSLLNRGDLARAPGLEAATVALRHHFDVEALGPVDLYACFPAVVTLTAGLLGLSFDRPLTVTGGLAFAGAPLNFAAGESLVGMVDALRADAGATGLVQGNGGHVAKHAFAIYSTTPPERPHASIAVDHDGPELPTADPDTSGPATLDGVTVDYEREGPVRAIGIVRFADGSRTWATSDDGEVMRRCTEEECVGRTVGVEAGVFAL